MLVLALLALSLVLQGVVLYAPPGPDVSAVPISDKVVHLTVFAVPAALGVLAGIRPVVVATVLAAHAVLSEVIQGVLLPTRSGDPLDAVADLIGIAIGIGVVSMGARWRRARRA